VLLKTLCFTYLYYAPKFICPFALQIQVKITPTGDVDVWSLSKAEEGENPAYLTGAAGHPVPPVSGAALVVVQGAVKIVTLR